MRPRSAAILLGLGLTLGLGSPTARADEPDPPALDPHLLADLCELLEEEAVTSRFDPASLERYRAECGERAMPPEPTPTPTTPTPVPPSPRERTADAPSTPPPADTAVDTVPAPAEPPAAPVAEAPRVDPPDPAPQQVDPDEESSEAPVDGTFDLPAVNYADLLGPEPAPVPTGASEPDEPRSARQADLIAAGTAVPLATPPDSFPRTALLAAALLTLIGARLIRRHIAKAT